MWEQSIFSLKKNLSPSIQVGFAWNNAADTILTEGDQSNKAIKPHCWQFYKQVLNYLIWEISVLDLQDMEQKVERKQLQQLGRVEFHPGLSGVLIFRLTQLWCDGSGEQMLPFSGLPRGEPAGPWRPGPWRKSGLIAEGMGERDRVYICSRSTLPSSHSLSEFNLQIIRKWGYTGREVKINLYPSQPLLRVSRLPPLAP